jgi:hypothetical protein
MLDEALQTPPPERFEKLKTLGDGTLYLSGFFGDHFEARGVNDGLVKSIGGLAYRMAAAMLRGPTGAEGVRVIPSGAKGVRGIPSGAKGVRVIDVYGELASRFDVFVGVLAEIAESTSFSAKTSTGALRLYEKWLRTGSERVARLLAAQGLVPAGGTKGVA